MVSIFSLPRCQDAFMRPGLGYLAGPAAGQDMECLPTSPYSYFHAFADVLSPWMQNPPPPAPSFLNPTQALKAQCRPLACDEVFPETPGLKPTLIGINPSHLWTPPACSVHTCAIPPSLQRAYRTWHCGLVTKVSLVSLDR